MLETEFIRSHTHKVHILWEKKTNKQTSIMTTLGGISMVKYMTMLKVPY